MRPSIMLLAASGCLVDATWLRWTGDQDLVGRGSQTPRETGAAAVDMADGWTPKPTPAPGSISGADAALELFRQRRATSNTWLDDTTCGWFSGTSSSAFTCTAGSKCATDSQHVVGCGSGAYTPFFTVCLDYQAYKQGACATIGTKTGCCDSSAHGACGTYLWPGKTQRSMYRCFASPTIISMIDKPQFVIDASRSSTSHPTSSKTASPTPTDPSGGNDDDDDDDGDSGSGSTNIGAIVGGVIGGVSGLALIAGVIAWLVIRTKARRRSSGRGNQAYNPVPPSDNTSPGSGGPLLPAYQAYQQPSPMSQPGGGGGGGATTFPPTSPYPGGDRHRYASLFSQEPTPSPPPVYGYPVGKPAGSPDPPLDGGGYVAVNELDSGAVPSGHQANPVEMGAGR